MEREARLARLGLGRPEFGFQSTKLELPLRYPSGNGVVDYLSP